MTRTRWIIALLVGATMAPDVSAQFFPVFGLPVVARDGVSFHIGGRRLRIDGFWPLGDPYTVILPVTPTPFGYRQVGPAYLPYYPGYYSYGPRVYGAVEQRVSVTVVTPAVIVEARRSVDLSGIDLDVESPDKLWGKKNGVAKGEKPARDADVARADERKVQVAANQARPPALPRPKLEDLPEGQKFLDQGITAFKNGEYGLALLRFRQSDEAIPGAPRALFFQGQALIAMGKYQEAAEVLQEALRNQPTWPTSNFHPRKELYTDKDDLWKDHRNRLEKAQLLRPKDADPLFLLGYLSWFDGQRDTAVDYFTQSKALAANPRWSDLFLKVAAK